MSLPPGARVLPMKPSNSRYKEEIEDAPASLQKLRRETLLPLSLERASIRVKRLKELYTIPVNALLIFHRNSVDAVVREMRLNKFVRNVKVEHSDHYNNSNNSYYEQEEYLNSSIAGTMCMPFTTCASCRLLNSEISNEEEEEEEYEEELNKQAVEFTGNHREKQFLEKEEWKDKKSNWEAHHTKLSSSATTTTTTFTSLNTSAILTGSVDGLITLWSVATSQPIAHNITGLNTSYSGRVEALATHPKMPICFSAHRLDTHVTAWKLPSYSSHPYIEKNNVDVNSNIKPKRNATQAQIAKISTLPSVHTVNDNNSSIDKNGWIKCITVDNTGTLLCTGCNNGNISFFDICSESEVSLCNVEQYHSFRYLYNQHGINGQGVNQIAFHPDGPSLCSVCDDGGRVITWDVRCGQVAFHTVMRNPPITATSSSFSQPLRKAGGSEAVDKHNYQAKRMSANVNVYDYGAHLQRARCVCWSPCGTLLCSGGADCVIQIWDVRMLYKQMHSASSSVSHSTRTAVNNITSSSNSVTSPFQLVGHEDEVTSISCYRHPHNIFSSSNNNNNSLNKAEDKGVTNKLFGSSSSINNNNDVISTLPFLLVSTSLDRTIKLWDMNTGGCVKTLQTSAPLRQHCLPQEHSYSLSSTVATEKESWIVSIGHDKYWSLWDLSEHDVHDVASTDTNEVVSVTKSTAATKSDNYTSNTQDEDKDEDEDDEMELLKRQNVPSTTSLAALQANVNYNDNEEEEEEDDDEEDDDEEDEMEMLKRKKV